MWKKKRIKGSKNPTGFQPIGACVHPRVIPRPVTDSTVLGQQRDWKEFLRQISPLVLGKHPQANKLLRELTAHTRGLKQTTAERLVTQGRSLSDFGKGAHPEGIFKEVVVAHDLRELHKGGNPGIINPPKKTQPNVVDFRLSPDQASRRDLLYSVDLGNDRFIFVRGPQVKTGDPQYVSDALCEMVLKLDYGKTGCVDARFVNPDGSPRVSADAFSETQASKLRNAGVRLRGFRNLDKRGVQLQENRTKFLSDRLDPASRKQLEEFRLEIVEGYSSKGVLGRTAANATIAFATAAIFSIVLQVAINDEVEIKAIKTAAIEAAKYGGAGTLIDSGIYHAANKVGKLSPEAAKTVAGQTVAVAFCIFATALDLKSEFESTRSGEVTKQDAIAHGCIKTALNFLPLVLSPMGPVAIPLLVVSQLGGRRCLSKLRESDKTTASLIAQANRDSAEIKKIATEIAKRQEENDRLFELAMNGTTKHKLILVKE